MANNQLVPVILCGGSGTRLWPLSRESYPKQFLKLNIQSNKTLLQQTQERLVNLKGLTDSILVCNEEHRFIVAEQMREIKIKPESIILEPCGKNTTPAIALAALRSMQTHKDPILIVLASDHLIKNQESFLKSLSIAINLAKEDKLVTFGVIPTSAEIGYGYIKSKQELESKNVEFSEIVDFLEKPSKKIAEKLIKDKRYSWNSGMFVFKAKNIIEELKRHQPELLGYCQKSINTATKDIDFIRISEEFFSKCKSISFDIAVMEKTKKGVVVRLEADWSDIGNWKSLWEFQEKNEFGNISNGNVILKDVYNSYFNSENRLLVGIGIKDLIAVETNDAVLIADKNSSQKIKDVVSELKKNKVLESTHHKKVHRPWGSYFSLVKEDKWQVKKIEVSPKASLSLQKHFHRSEHWVVVKGKALISIDNKESILEENQSAYIPIGSKHQLSNPTEYPLILIEVQSGNYLGEDDIVRFKDQYGR